ncbi:MAG: Crp/Fnr family transcriptional regulator [Ilumatobacteraceae bacterium]
MGAKTTVADVIAAHGRRRTLLPGEVLFFEGDRSREVYLCVSGQIRIFLSLSSGRELVLGTKEAGDAFGEIAALDTLPRSAGASSVGQTVVASMPGDRFAEEVFREPALALEVLRGLARQIRRATAGLSARTNDSAAVRTGRTILELAELMAPPGPSAKVELPITQADLADRIGATRESTARAIGEFRRAGVVATGRGRIVVLDIDGLADLVRSI